LVIVATVVAVDPAVDPAVGATPLEAEGCLGLAEAATVEDVDEGVLTSSILKTATYHLTVRVAPLEAHRWRTKLCQKCKMSC